MSWMGVASLVGKGYFLPESRVEYKILIIQKHYMPLGTCTYASQASLPQIQMGAWEATLTYCSLCVESPYLKKSEGI